LNNTFIEKTYINQLQKEGCIVEDLVLFKSPGLPLIDCFMKIKINNVLTYYQSTFPSDNTNIIEYIKDDVVRFVNDYNGLLTANATYLEFIKYQIEKKLCFDERKNLFALGVTEELAEELLEKHGAIPEVLIALDSIDLSDLINQL